MLNNYIGFINFKFLISYFFLQPAQFSAEASKAPTEGLFGGAPAPPKTAPAPASLVERLL